MKVEKRIPIVVVDADEVIVDLNGALQKSLASKGHTLNLDMVKTYSYNRNLSAEDRLKLGISDDDITHGVGVEWGYIYDEFTSQSLFREVRPFGEGTLEGLSRLSKLTKMIWHTASMNVESSLAKVSNLNGLLNDNNIDACLSVSMQTDVHKESHVLAKGRPIKITPLRKVVPKPVFICDYVIEDCLDNLLEYEGTSTMRILVDRRHNSEEFNTQYKDLFKSGNYIRVGSTLEAVEYIERCLEEDN